MAVPEVVRVWCVSDLHVDHAANLDWVANLPRPRGDGRHALVVAGDVSADLDRLRCALSALRSSYDDVFYVPGNHEAWVTGRDAAAAYPDSIAKLQACARVGATKGCVTGTSTSLVSQITCVSRDTPSPHERPSKGDGDTPREERWGHPSRRDSRIHS